MKTAVGIVTLLFLTATVFSCSGKIDEKEYFTRASQYMEQENWEQAAASFEKLYAEYPQGLFSSKALFMMGYINANHLKNLEKARQYYGEFLEKFPEHELATAAKYELENLGKDVDQLPFLKDENPGQTVDSQSSSQQAASSK